MAAISIQPGALHRLDEIYRYTRDHWGVEQADRYITDLFETFEKQFFFEKKNQKTFVH